MGDRKKASRKRAVGTREAIVAYLADVYELFDPSGMASAQLAAAVGYPGSSVAFAQLLSGMERSGLIERDVRGKRTYRIRLGQAQAETTTGGAAGAGGSARVPGPARAGGSAPGSGAGPAGFDYDELARRLLAQVVRRLAGTEQAGTEQAGTEQAGTKLAGTGPDSAEPDSAGPDGARPDSAALQGRVASLECELASAWTRHGKLAEENARLREQLRDAQRSLALARESLRKLPTTAELDSAEVVLLQRLLTPADEAAGAEQPRPLGALRP